MLLRSPSKTSFAIKVSKYAFYWSSMAKTKYYVLDALDCLMIWFPTVSNDGNVCTYSRCSRINLINTYYVIQTRIEINQAPPPPQIDHFQFLSANGRWLPIRNTTPESTLEWSTVSFKVRSDFKNSFDLNMVKIINILQHNLEFPLTKKKSTSCSPKNILYIQNY